MARRDSKARVCARVTVPSAPGIDAPEAATAGARAVEVIKTQRATIFGAMAMIDVARDSLDIHEYPSLRRVLSDAYQQLDHAASELHEIGQYLLPAEVPHG